MTKQQLNRIDFTEVGKKFGFKKSAVLREIETAKWEPVKGNKPFMQACAIQEAINQLRIPKVSMVAVHSGIGSYGLYGIRAHYKQGQVDIFIGDDGTSIAPVCMVRYFDK